MKNNVVVNMKETRSGALADLAPGTVFRFENKGSLFYMITNESTVFCINNGEVVTDVELASIVFPVAQCKIDINL